MSCHFFMRKMKPGEEPGFGGGGRTIAFAFLRPIIHANRNNAIQDKPEFAHQKTLEAHNGSHPGNVIEHELLAQISTKILIKLRKRLRYF